MVWWWCIGCLFAAMSQLLDVTVFHVEANPRKMCSTPKKKAWWKIWGQLGFVQNAYKDAVGGKTGKTKVLPLLV